MSNAKGCRARRRWVGHPVDWQGGHRPYSVRSAVTKQRPDHRNRRQRPQPSTAPTTHRIRSMPITTTQAQARWHEIVNDPALQDLPYKVETNRRGQLILSPHSNRHSLQQRAILHLLDRHAPAGMSAPEFALATNQGVKVPDVVWMSDERWEAMQQTGDPSTLAPEICVEVLSASNTVEELAEKRTLYRDAGADEVWLVEPDGRIRFFRASEMDRSEIAPDCPSHT